MMAIQRFGLLPNFAQDANMALLKGMVPVGRLVCKDMIPPVGSLEFR